MADPSKGPDEPADDHGDELPADLDVTAYVGMYTFPDIRRRRAPAVADLVLAAGLGILYAMSSGGGVLVNGGFLAVAVVLALLWVISFFAGSAGGRSRRAWW